MRPRRPWGDRLPAPTGDRAPGPGLTRLASRVWGVGVPAKPPPGRLLVLRGCTSVGMVTHTVGTGRVRALRRDDDRPLLSVMAVEGCKFAKGSPDSMALVVSPRPPLALALVLALGLVLALVAVRVVEEEEDKEEATEDPVTPRASPASLPPSFLRPLEGRAKSVALAWEELESGRPKVLPATGLPGWPLAACPGGNA